MANFNVPTLVCERCPTDAGAFYTSDLAMFEQHQADLHLRLADLRPCRKCGEPTTGHFDGLCRDCFIAAYSD